jgi:membrane protein implicated in regulation of membrane protease activity
MRLIAVMLLALVVAGCCGPNQQWDFWKAKCVPVVTGKSDVDIPAVVAKAKETIDRETTSAKTVVAKMVEDSIPAAADVATLAHDYPDDLRVKNLTLYFGKALPEALDALTIQLNGIQIANDALAPVPAAAKQNDAAIAAAAARADAAEKKLADYDSKFLTTVRWILAGLSLLGALAVAGGVYMTVQGTLKGGLAVAIAGLVVCGVCGFLAMYMVYVVWGVAIAAGAGVVVLVVYLVVKYRQGQATAVKAQLGDDLTGALAEIKARVANMPDDLKRDIELIQAQWTTPVKVEAILGTPPPVTGK